MLMFKADSLLHSRTVLGVCLTYEELEASKAGKPVRIMLEELDPRLQFEVTIQSFPTEADAEAALRAKGSLRGEIFPRPPGSSVG